MAKFGLWIAESADPTPLFRIPHFPLRIQDYSSRMTLLDRLEKCLSRYAVPNITLMLILGQVVTYLIAYQQRAAGGGTPLLENIALVPALVLQGEIWRLFTFLIYPPSLNDINGINGVLGPISAFFYWYLFYLMGTALETTWGTFRYNLFLLIGYVASLAVAFTVPGAVATNIFLYSSVFLAFARLFPEFTLMLMLLLPIKIKWLALLQWIGYAFTFYQGPNAARAMIAAAVLNYFLFFGRFYYREVKHRLRKRRFAAQANRPGRKRGRLIHTCTVCGATSEQTPRVPFRYCSQCSGQQCYCPEHLHNHKHVTAPATEAKH